MKRLINVFAVMLLVAIISCSKGSPANGGNPPPPPPPAPPTGPINDTGTLQGTFTNGVHTTKGQAVIKIMGSSAKLYFEGFQTDSGPDLYVYLATTKTASSFINLGLLKAVTGNQEYDVPNSTDFNKYKYVLIWCQQFGVLFGSAEIK